MLCQRGRLLIERNCSFQLLKFISITWMESHTRCWKIMVFFSASWLWNDSHDYVSLLAALAVNKWANCPSYQQWKERSFCPEIGGFQDFVECMMHKNGPRIFHALLMCFHSRNSTYPFHYVAEIPMHEWKAFTNLQMSKLYLGLAGIKSRWVILVQTLVSSS